MRVLWILIALGLAAAAVWWLNSGSPSQVDEGLDTESAAGEAERAGLEGRAEDLVAEGESTDLDGSEAIRGSVEDTRGNRLAGVLVELEQYVERTFLEDRAGAWLHSDRVAHPTPLQLVATTRTGEDGRFAFRGLPRSGASYLVRAASQAPWFSATRHASIPWNMNFVRLVVGKGTPLRVRVVDAEESGVSAFLSGYSQREGPDWHPHGFHDVRTNAQGRATLYLPDGAFHCSVLAPGIGARYGVLLEAPQSREVVIPFGMRGGAVVEGTVTDTTGQPVRGAYVHVMSGRGHDERLSRLAQTDAAGAYRVDGLLPANLEQVAVAATGFVTIINAAPQLALRAGATQRIDVTLVRGGVLEGTVTGPDGRAVAGTFVKANAEPGRRGAANEDKAVTDAHGRYRMTHVPLGAGYVRVSAPGLFQEESKGLWYVIDGESDRKTVDVALARGIPVTGRVVDAARNPVPGASVLVEGSAKQGWWRSDYDERSATTDARGRFAYPGLPPGRWHLVAKTETSLSFNVDVSVAADTEPPAPVEIVLQPGAVIEGRVVISGDATNERLRVHADGPTNKTVPVLVDGSFRIAGLIPGAYEVVVVDWHHDGISNRVDVKLTWGQTESDIVLETGALGWIAGVVVDEDDEPVPNIRLSLDVSTPQRSRGIDTETNARGRFAFPSVPDTGRAYAISIGNERKPGTYEPGDTDVRLTHSLPESVRFLGKVRLPDGTPAASGSVMITEVTPRMGRRRPERRSNHKVPIFTGVFGQAFPRHAPASTFEAEVREVFDEQGRMISVQPMKIENVEPETPVDFHLVAGLEVAGVVVDDEGTPVPNVAVSIEPKGDTLDFHRKNMQSRPDGTFWFGSLSPSAITVHVQRLPAPWIAPPSMEIEAGDKEVRVTLIRGGTIRGTVLDLDGRPAARAGVYWNDRSGRNLSATSDEKGQFELFPVPPDTDGSVTASPPANVEVPMLGPTVHAVRAGKDGLELRLSRAALIKGEVAGPDGEEVANAWVMCYPAEAPQKGAYHAQVNDKKFEVGPLPPGRYRVQVQVTNGSYVAPDPIEVTAPVEDVRVVIPKGLTITGTLTGGENLGRFYVQFMHTTSDGPRAVGGRVTTAGQFLVTLKEDWTGTLFFRDYQGTHDLYGVVENVRPSPDPLTVELRRGLTIAGRFDDYEASEQGHVYVMTRSGVTPGADAAEDGSFVIHGVPPGKYDLHASRAQKRLDPIVGVAAGTTGLVFGKP